MSACKGTSGSHYPGPIHVIDAILLKSEIEIDHHTGDYMPYSVCVNNH